MSTILGRIEAGFGERLKRIDEGYNKLEGYYIKSRPEEINEQQIQISQQEVKKVEEEKDKIIQGLLQKTKLQTVEKKRIVKSLKIKDEELEKTKRELIVLQEDFDMSGIESQVLDWFLRHVVDENKILRHTKTNSVFRKEFNNISSSLNPNWIEDLKRLGWLNSKEQLTLNGVRNLLKSLK